MAPRDGELYQPDRLVERDAVGLDISLTEDAGRSTQRIEQLVRLGIGSDVTKMAYYRRVVTDPHRSVQNPVLRPYCAEVLDKVLTVIFSDEYMYNRLRNDLQRRGFVTRRVLSVAGKVRESLERKAAASGWSLEQLLEVYQRGVADDRGGPNGPEQRGFARVNSFIAGGAAADMDRDLVLREETTERRSPLATVRRLIREGSRK